MKHKPYRQNPTVIDVSKKSVHHRGQLRLFVFLKSCLESAAKHLFLKSSYEKRNKNAKVHMKNANIYCFTAKNIGNHESKYILRQCDRSAEYVAVPSDRHLSVRFMQACSARQIRSG